MIEETDLSATLRIFEPYPGVFAYYDGRIPGKRLYSQERNWLDDGAYVLGIASYAVTSGNEALVYDTHISPAHARAIRAHLEGLGIDTLRVVLSHKHADHIAGNAVFADCEIIALERTADGMVANRAKLETGTPPISPLIMPNRLFAERLDLTVGARRVELHHFEIHSNDGNVLWLPESRVLLAGDTLEDPITYIAEAEHIAKHIEELGRMRSWPIWRILPNHGAAEVIAAGGYGAALIDGNRHYLERLLQADRADVEAASLADLIAEDIVAGRALYFAPYEVVHRGNIAALDKARVAKQ
jgi:glyoxylase-like metal-dependent hydrolase (beta-lactamase superfamily II)